jgi:DNA-binding transcriptional LysR family regulator
MLIHTQGADQIMMIWRIIGVELRQLEQFVAVAEENQFTRAAARCGIAASALSTSIRAFEHELGTQLFARTTRRVSLTATGHVLLVEARKTLAAAAATRAVVDSLQEPVRGSLAVGGIPTTGVVDQPALLQRFRTRHPGVVVRYTRDVSTALIGAVREGTLDVAIASLPPGDPLGDLHVLELANGPVLLACHPLHRLAGHRRVTAADLAGEDFVVGLPGSHGRLVLERLFAATGIGATISYEVNDIPTLLDFVEHGLGVTLAVAPFVVGRPKLCTVPLADRSVTWTLAAITRHQPTSTPTARALLGMLP